MATMTVLWTFLKAYWPYLLAAAVAAAFFIWLADRDSDNVTKGVTQEQVRQQEQVIENVGVANDAETQILDPGSCVRYINCLRNDRDTTSCKRYVPADKTGADCY